MTTQSRAVLQTNNSQSETQSHFEIKPRIVKLLVQIASMFSVNVFFNKVLL